MEATFDDLLGWNRWWLTDRINNGLLSYGSSPAANPFNEPVFGTRVAAGYESGMDDSPMYVGVPFNKNKKTLELQDVGLNSLYIADCYALAEMAGIIGRLDEQNELLKRAEEFSQRMQDIWDPDLGAFLNYRTDVDTFSSRVSPTMFYPLLSSVGDKDQMDRIVGYFYDTNKFYGCLLYTSDAADE